MNAPASPSRHSNLAGLPINVWLAGQETPEKQRQGRYTTHSVRGHPGKMLPAIARRLIDGYTKPGDWVLDPMSGIGTTGVEAVHLGRHYVGVELEPRFVAWQKENLERAREAGGTGRCAVFEGDAGKLVRPDQLPGEPGPLAAAITSPPYGDRLGRWHRTGGLTIGQILRFGRSSAVRLEPGIYGTGRANVGNAKGERYLAAMRRIYAGCYQVLKPGGILAIVIQPERYHHHLYPLHHFTARLCQEIGFELLDEIVALLCRVAAPPGDPARTIAHARFWRRLGIAKRRAAGFPVTLNQVEYVLVFRRPEEPPAARPVRSRQPNKSGLSAALAGPRPRLGSV